MAETAATADYTFFEFFAGGGMVRAGLGHRWQCLLGLFANDFDFKKSKSYSANWGINSIVTKDVAKLDVKEIPDHADLAWASVPCQHLSVAGKGAGLKGDRSGTVWPFWRLIKKLAAKKRGPRVVVLENAFGTLTSHGGKDFTAIASALAEGGYRHGAIVIDAAHFVPQSRSRLFIVAVAKGVAISSRLFSTDATAVASESVSNGSYATEG